VPRVRYEPDASRSKPGADVEQQLLADVDLVEADAVFGRVAGVQIVRGPASGKPPVVTDPTRSPRRSNDADESSVRNPPYRTSPSNRGASGRLVMMWMTPAMASEPYNVEPGPFTISMRSMRSALIRDRSSTPVLAPDHPLAVHQHERVGGVEALQRHRGAERAARGLDAGDALEQVGGGGGAAPRDRGRRR
jgi:hypothetical protein